MLQLVMISLNVYVHDYHISIFRSQPRNDDSTRQGTQVITSMASESFSSMKSNPTPKVNSCSGREPVRTSNSSNTPAVEQLPSSQIAFLYHQKLAQVDHNTEPKSEKNKVSSGHSKCLFLYNFFSTILATVECRTIDNKCWNTLDLFHIIILTRKYRDKMSTSILSASVCNPLVYIWQRMLNC